MKLVDLPESKAYPAVGHCIYCLANDGTLTHEHIIPFALGGEAVIKAASCNDCRDEIREYESDVLNWTYLQARTFLNLPVYKPEFRAKDLRLGAFRETGRLVGEDFRWETLRTEEHPAAVIGFQFLEPGILCQREKTPTFQVVGQSVSMLNGAPPPTLPTGERLGNFIRFEPEKLTKFMAKIAHGAAVAALGEAFFEPLLSDIIRNRDANISHLVGSPVRTRWPRRSALHRVTLTQERGFSLAYVQLFARYASPPYLVVVGLPKAPGASLNWHARSTFVR